MDDSPKKSQPQSLTPKHQLQDLQPFESLNSREASKEEVPSVNDAKLKLDNLIQDLNDKLVNHFRMKEEALLNQYKAELIQQQHLLNELKNNTNQQQIRQKMLDRKAELEKQRNHLIQTNMFFSQKCEQYKVIYSKLARQSQDLEKQIKYLDCQIEDANAKRLNLIDQVGASERETTNLPLFTDQKRQPLDPEKNENSTLAKTKQTSSVKKIGRSLQVIDQKPKKSSSIRQLPKLERNLLQKPILQKLFEESVEEVKNRRKSKRTMPNLKGEQFTQYEKRAIMQIFLGNEEVKKKIYEIIFAESSGEKSAKGALRGVAAGQKVKISFEQLGL